MKALHFTISGTASNAGKARTCIQRRDLAPYGFDFGTPYDWARKGSSFVLKAGKGERKVAKLTDKRRGHTYQTIDLRYSQDERAKVFGNAERLIVIVRKGVITITAEEA